MIARIKLSYLVIEINVYIGRETKRLNYIKEICYGITEGMECQVESTTQNVVQQCSNDGKLRLAVSGWQAENPGL